MSPLTNCLSEEELWRLVQQEDTDRASHVQGCEKCRARLERLERSLHEFHQFVDVNEIAQSGVTEIEPDLFSPIHEKSQPLSGPEFIEQNTRKGHTLNRGTFLERYRILKLLNSGGQGDVYLAEDPQLQRQVAIKLSHSSIDESVIPAEKIVAEGELLAQVSHPRLAQVYDSGVFAGHPFLVMEYVNGCSLKEYMKGRTLSEKMIRRTITDVSTALEALHSRGVLHLDIKPENVMILANGRCKLIDLGTGWWSTQTNKNLDAVCGGTVGYMSPEQIAADPSLYCEKTDVFGLGALLFALLRNDYSPAKPETETVTNDLSWKLKRQQLQALKVDRRLKRICFKATLSNPDRRFQSVAALRKSIEPQYERGGSAILLITGLLASLNGIFALSTPERDSVVQQISDENQQLSQPTLSPEQTPEFSRTAKIEVHDHFDSPIQFCVWSNETGMQFRPAIQNSESQNQKTWVLKTAGLSLDLSSLGNQFAILAVPTQYIRPQGTPALRSAIHQELQRSLLKRSSENTYSKTQNNQSATQTLLIGGPGHFSKICGVMISEMTSFHDPQKYEIRISLDQSLAEVRLNHEEILLVNDVASQRSPTQFQSHQLGIE